MKFFVEDIEKVSNSKIKVLRSVSNTEDDQECKIEIVSSFDDGRYLVKVSDNVCFYLNPYDDLKNVL